MTESKKKKVAKKICEKKKNSQQKFAISKKGKKITFWGK